MKKYYLLLCLLFFASCTTQQGCVPKFADLKTQFPHVLYHGPNEPSEVVVKRYPPAGWVSLNQVSKYARGAILVSEDWAFYQHPGYDAQQIREAITESINRHKLKRGASTITQQVVRNIYLSKEKTLSRKAHELWLSTKIEKVLTKNRILELYLNIAEFGEGIYGIEPAARHYFNKDASELSPKEGAFLAMLLPSPKRYAVSFQKHELTPYARKIIHSVLGKMVQAHYLSDAEKSEAWMKPLSFEAKVDPTIPVDDDEDSTDFDEEDPVSPEQSLHSVQK